MRPFQRLIRTFPSPPRPWRIGSRSSRPRCRTPQASEDAKPSNLSLLYVKQRVGADTSISGLETQCVVLRGTASFRPRQALSRYYHVKALTRQLHNAALLLTLRGGVFPDKASMTNYKLSGSPGIPTKEVMLIILIAL